MSHKVPVSYSQKLAKFFLTKNRSKIWIWAEFSAVVKCRWVVGNNNAVCTVKSSKQKLTFTIWGKHGNQTCLVHGQAYGQVVLGFQRFQGDQWSFSTPNLKWDIQCWVHGQAFTGQLPYLEPGALPCYHQFLAWRGHQPLEILQPLF